MFSFSKAYLKTEFRMMRQHIASGRNKWYGSALAFIKESATHPAPLCGSPFISCEGDPFMQQFADHALCAGTHSQSANCCMAELLRQMLFFVNSLENLRKIR